MELKGRAAAPGVAARPAFIIDTGANEVQASLLDTRNGNGEEEAARLTEALQQTERELRELARRVAETAGEEEADIFEAHAEFAADPELRAGAETAIEAGASAERAVIDTFNQFRELLASSESEYLAARAADLDDVRDRVVAILQGRATDVPVPAAQSVIVARELTPSQTASLPRDLIGAIVTETGSPTSHAAILARSLGIPAVVACTGLLSHVEPGVTIAVDGGLGKVVVDPSAQEVDQIHQRIREEQQRRDELARLRNDPGRTADGRHVELAANIGSPQDLAPAVAAGAEGSGLVRTEFLFLDRTMAPSVDDQQAFYVEVLRAFPGQRVVFRTMDIGADKPLPFVARQVEDNPALGLRGIRLSLVQRHLLTDQLRALLRARHQLADESAGRTAVMFPLISNAREMEDARNLLDKVAQEEGASLDGVEVGAMIEVPSAALGARRIARRADFLSIGTNDLLQYLFAADRLNGLVSDLGDVCEPDVLDLIQRVVAAGHDERAWVGVCGEAASDPTVAAALVGLDVDELSMTRVAIPEVKDVLRRLSSEDCRTAVTTAIEQAEDGAQARRIIEGSLQLTNVVAGDVHPPVG